VAYKKGSVLAKIDHFKQKFAGQNTHVIARQIKITAIFGADFTAS
jgi:hypothetical protein